MTTMFISQNSASCAAPAIQEANKNRFEQVSFKKDFHSCLNNNRWATALKVTVIAPVLLYALDGLMIAAEKITNAAIGIANFVHSKLYGRTVEVMTKIDDPILSITDEEVVIANEEVVIANEAAVAATPSSNFNWIAGATVVAAVATGIYFTTGYGFVANGINNIFSSGNSTTI